MTEMEPDIYPPTNSPVMKTNDMTMTIISFLQLLVQSSLGGGLYILRFLQRLSEVFQFSLFMVQFIQTGSKNFLNQLQHTNLIFKIITNIIFIIVNKRTQTMSTSRRFEIVRNKFNTKTVKQLLQIMNSVDWSQPISTICQQINSLTSEANQGKFVWLVGANPSYFVQYQIDSYAIFKTYDKAVIVWKPKYLEYPAIVKLTQFGDDPKIIKSMQVAQVQKYGNISVTTEESIANFLKMYYGMFYFSGLSEEDFQKNMLTELKHYTSRITKESYWHCTLDRHQKVDVTTKHIYLRMRIKGVKGDYDKDMIIFSQKGIRQFMLKGKSFQIISFLAMLIIFVAVISCSSSDAEGMCYYRDQMIFAGAVVMMGLLGIRVVNRKKYKKQLDKKIQQIEKQD